MNGLEGGDTKGDKSNENAGNRGSSEHGCAIRYPFVCPFGPTGRGWSCRRQRIGNIRILRIVWIVITQIRVSVCRERCMTPNG